MSRMVGTVSRGVRAPIIRMGDDLAEIVTNSVLEAAADDGFAVRDRDIVAMTEAIVARAQGNYATVNDIAEDVRVKFGGETVGVIFPILSRNRFAICLRGIAMGAKKVVLMLSYPSDEVGNHLVSLDMLDEKGVDPYKDVLSLEKYRELFGYEKHPFTGVDFHGYYFSLWVITHYYTCIYFVAQTVPDLVSGSLFNLAHVSFSTCSHHFLNVSFLIFGSINIPGSSYTYNF